MKNVYFTNCNGDAISIENDSVRTRTAHTSKVKKDDAEI
jgi:hypothetical protein